MMMTALPRTDAYGNRAVWDVHERYPYSNDNVITRDVYRNPNTTRRPGGE